MGNESAQSFGLTEAPTTIEESTTGLMKLVSIYFHTDGALRVPTDLLYYLSRSTNPPGSLIPANSLRTMVHSSHTRYGEYQMRSLTCPEEKPRVGMNRMMNGMSHSMEQISPFRSKGRINPIGSRVMGSRSILKLKGLFREEIDIEIFQINHMGQ